MRLVVFDMDGTLIDTAGLIFDVLTHTFTAAGLAPPGRKAAREIIGLSLPVALGRLAGTEDGPTLERLVQTYRTQYRAILAAPGEQREPLFPAAREVVERLAARPDTLLGIATGKALAGVHRILDLHGLADRFVTLQTPDHNPSKPDPGMLISAMRETGVGPAETVMVGDTVYDIELGRAAGAHTVGVAWGYHDPEDLRRCGADAIISHFDELDAVVDDILGHNAHA